MPLRYQNKPGRTYLSTFERFSSTLRQVAALTQNAPKTHEQEGEAAVTALSVKAVDFCVSANVESHHTEEYDITEDHFDPEGQEIPAQLVVRRGQAFHIKVTFDRPYDKSTDGLKAVFEIGKEPIVSKNTSQCLVVEKGIRPRHWSAGVKCQDENTVTLDILAPADCIIGKWTLHIDTQVKESGQPPTRYTHPHPVYIIFNPWCREDLVYLDDEVLRDEYILNDHGKVYTGNYKQIAGKPWNFGQYEDFVLDCSLTLLDLAHISLPARCDVVPTVRAISAIVNSPDDSGVLVGNWSGSYTEGTAPTHWVSSVAILEQFWKTRNPVKFGQCWVFSALCVTICRALGIPCRSVTNYSSAHDCDGSITIDTHWDSKGQPLEDFNQDSVWNFHVWNEAWMMRPDLPAGFGGWQAFDATPQETSDGVYCAGPCSIVALKQGQVNYPYDAKFIFAEVNADKVHWIMDGEGNWSKVYQKHNIGKRISTKRPRNVPAPETPKWDVYSFLGKDDKDRLDITQEYKFKEGTEEERTAVYRANTWSTRAGVYDYGNEDVKFEVCQKDEILVGSNFDVVVKAQNKSREERNVNLTVTLTAMYYTGVPKAKVKSKNFDLTLGPVRAEEAVMRITGEEYLHLIVDQVAFKISVLANVSETEQVFADHDDFRLRRPDLELECPESLTVGTPVKCIVHFSNSMPVHLTQCEWKVEGVGMQMITVPQKDLEPYDQVNIEVELKPKKAGQKTIIASFTSKELTDVTGQIDVKVLRAE